jgi:thioredoxin-related protein
MRLRIQYFLPLAIGLLALSCDKSNDHASAAQPSPTVAAQQQPVSRPADPSPSIVLAADNSIRESSVINENGWYTDWNAGMAAADAQHRPVIVDFYTDWCHWCTEMDQKTFSNLEIKKKFADGWIMIKVNAEDDKGTCMFKGVSLTYPELARRFGVTGYPSYAFIDKKGEPVNVLAGYREVPQFTVILDYFQKEIYTLSSGEQQNFIDSQTKAAGAPGDAKK